MKLDQTVEGESGLDYADEVSNFIWPTSGRRLQVSGDGTDTFSCGDFGHNDSNLRCPLFTGIDPPWIRGNSIIDFESRCLCELNTNRLNIVLVAKRDHRGTTSLVSSRVQEAVGWTPFNSNLVLEVDGFVCFGS